MRRIDDAQVDDVVSEVFTVVWRRLHEVEPDSDRAWIFGIARNVLRNHWRDDARRSRLADRARQTRPINPPQPEDVALAKAEGSDVVHALRVLKTADQEILMLSAWEQLSGPEIAEALGVSVNTIHQRLFRAKKRLATALDQLSSEERSR